MERTPPHTITPSIALFGAAQRGALSSLYYCRALDELFSYLGEPPKESEGLFHAIQALLHGFSILYVRVHNEGMSEREYHRGMQFLLSLPDEIRLGALFLPGVGSPQVLEEGIDVCRKHHGLLIIKEADFYDYLTAA